MTLSHLDENGEVHMVDISSKERSQRLARAECSVIFPDGLLKDILEEGTQKGDLFATARLGGIQAAKKTPELIPLTHPIALDHAKIELEASVPGDKITVRARVKASDATGVEMEALNAASTAA
ncbi:MAG: cyclic pyranopterin monophosphate synthase, partial [bacterium]